jgi:hypothetical protein
MMVATNWGVYEFGKRDMQFRDKDDPRDMQIRARDAGHLEALRERFPTLGETIYLGDGVSDFQYRVYITHKQLCELMYVVTGGIDYVRFKEGASKDHTLHDVLSAMWTTLLRAYPKGSSYTTGRQSTFQARVQEQRRTKKRNRHHQDQPLPPRMHWWEDTDRTERTENF